jgi:hypothetical protein
MRILIDELSMSDSGTPFLAMTAKRPVTRGWLDCRMASFWRQRKQRSLRFSLLSIKVSNINKI